MRKMIDKKIWLSLILSFFLVIGNDATILTIKAAPVQPGPEPIFNMLMSGGSEVPLPNEDNPLPKGSVATIHYNVTNVTNTLRNRGINYDCVHPQALIIIGAGSGLDMNLTDGPWAHNISQSGTNCTFEYTFTLTDPITVFQAVVNDSNNFIYEFGGYSNSSMHIVYTDACNATTTITVASGTTTITLTSDDDGEDDTPGFEIFSVIAIIATLIILRRRK